MTDTQSTPTIGVFDSGFGGLTVLRALMGKLPRARFAFIGDTARLPTAPSRAARSLATPSRAHSSWSANKALSSL